MLNDEYPMVVIGCPVQNREKVLPTYLEAIEHLDYPLNRVILFFYVNNSTDKSLEIIQEFFKKYRGEFFYCHVVNDKVLKGRQDDQSRTNSRDYSLFTVVRNNFLKRLKNLPNFDYLFSVDSDILLPQDALRKLIDNKKDICSALCLNASIDGMDFYNVLVEGDEGHYYHFPIDQKEPFKISATGGCILIKREVLKAGVRYAFHEQGEDLPFCKSALEKGFEVWCDPSIRPEHTLEGKTW